MSIICHADISKNADFRLKHNFTIFKDGKLVFTTVSDKEDARYEIPVAKSSHTGDYECTVKAGGKLGFSTSVYVWVEGECSVRCGRYRERTTLQGRNNSH